MPRGAKPGERRGGRQKGTPNRKSAELIAKAKAAGLLPHEFLLAVMRGEAIDGHIPAFEERLDAAKAAAPYFAPRLAATSHSGEIGVRNLDEMTDHELAAIATGSSARATAAARGKAVTH